VLFSKGWDVALSCYSVMYARTCHMHIAAAVQHACH
jgi:hypothetical protein